MNSLFEALEEWETILARLILTIRGAKMKNSHRDFNKLSKGKTPAPFSLRPTFEERAKLEEAVNGLPLGAYIKARLFDGDLEKVRRRNARPIADHVALGGSSQAPDSPAFHKT
ncbi:hypothetical protein AB9K41_21390 [Cribrihabitans sp. XS_ASV171]